MRFLRWLFGAMTGPCEICGGLAIDDYICSRCRELNQNTARRPASKKATRSAQSACRLSDDPAEEGACSRRSAPANPNVGRSGASEELLSVQVGPPRIPELVIEFEEFLLAARGR